MLVLDKHTHYGQRYLPYLSFDFGRKIELSVSEAMVWSLFGWYNSLNLQSLNSGPGASQGGIADLYLKIGVMDLGDIDLIVTFKASPESR